MHTTGSLTASRSIRLVGLPNPLFPPNADPPWTPPPPMWTEGMTHAFENIIFRQLLLRVVRIDQASIPEIELGIEST